MRPGRLGSVVVLVAHGSRDPRAEPAVSSVAAAVSRRMPEVQVLTSQLDHAERSPADVLVDAARGGVRSAVVVPLLFASGYHLRVDLPAQVADAADRAPGLETTLVGPLIDGRHDPYGLELVLDALDARASEATAVAWVRARADGLVLMSAGSSDASARATVERLGTLWGLRHDLPVAVAFASGPGPAPAEAVGELRSRGAAHVLAGSLFVAPGRLPTSAAASARSAGAVVASVLGPADGLVALVARRAELGGRTVDREVHAPSSATCVLPGCRRRGTARAAPDPWSFTG